MSPFPAGTAQVTPEKALESYVRFYESLSPQSLPQIAALFTPDARFKDPFNDVIGPDKIHRVFEDMFKTIGQPDFRVTDKAWGNEPGQCYIRWHFAYRVRGRGEPIAVDGMSAVRFAPDGRVSSHIDYWDAGQGLYEHLPILGPILRWIRKRLKVE